MLNSFDENLFFNQKVEIKKNISKEEILLHNYFHENTNIYPKKVIAKNDFIFYFVNNKDYFKVKGFLNSMREQFPKRKILIIRAESTLLRLLFNFFPDTYIHDITLGLTEDTGKQIINVKFLFYKDRGIAIGRKGEYIKVVNEIFNNYVVSEKPIFPIKIRCDLVDIADEDIKLNSLRS